MAIILPSNGIIGKHTQCCETSQLRSSPISSFTPSTAQAESQNPYCQAQPSLNPAKAELCSFSNFSSHPYTNQPWKDQEIKIKNSIQKKLICFYELSPKIILNLNPSHKHGQRANKGKKNDSKMGQIKMHFIEHKSHNKRWLST